MSQKMNGKCSPFDNRRRNLAKRKQIHCRSLGINWTTICSICIIFLIWSDERTKKIIAMKLMELIGYSLCNLNVGRDGNHNANGMRFC